MTPTPPPSNSSRLPSLVIGGILVLLGACFLIWQVANFAIPVNLRIDLGRYGWPLFILIPGGALFVVGMFLPRGAGQALTALGSIITATGILLAYQNLTNHWESWAYAWALVTPASMGLGWFLYGALHRDNKLARDGLRLATIGFGIFLVGAVFFELVIGISGLRSGLVSIGLPILVILFGLGVLVAGLFRRR